VLVGPGQEVHRPALQASPAGDEVARHGGVGVPEMRDVVDVVDRRCQVKGVLAHCAHSGGGLLSVLSVSA
jgi:hypothetical protein